MPNGAEQKKAGSDPVNFGIKGGLLPRLKGVRTLSCLCLATLVGATAWPQAITLRLNPPAGKKAVYSATTAIQMKAGANSAGPMNMDSTQRITMTLEVLSKSAKGFKVRTTISDVSVTAPKGSMMEGMAKAIEDTTRGFTVTGLYDPLGNNVGKLEMGGKAAANPLASSMSNMGAGFLGVVFPSGPVSPGSTWKSSIDMKDMMGAASAGAAALSKGGQIPISYKLLKVEKRGGKTLAHILYSMKGSAEMGAPSGAKSAATKVTLVIDAQGTVVVDVATGFPESSAAKGRNTIRANGMDVVQTMDISMKLKK